MSATYPPQRAVELTDTAADEDIRLPMPAPRLAALGPLVDLNHTASAVAAMDASDPWPLDKVIQRERDKARAAGIAEGRAAGRSVGRLEGALIGFVLVAVAVVVACIAFAAMDRADAQRAAPNPTSTWSATA